MRQDNRSPRETQGERNERSESRLRALGCPSLAPRESAAATRRLVNRGAGNSPRRYLLFDGRAIGGDPADATLLVSCESNDEAKSYRGLYGAMACYSVPVEGLAQLVNGEATTDDLTWEWDWTEEP